MTLLAAAYLNDTTGQTALRVFDVEAGTTLFTSDEFGTAQFGSPFNTTCGVSVDSAYVSVSAVSETRIYKRSDWSYITVPSNYEVRFAPDGKAYGDLGEIDLLTGAITPYGFAPGWFGSRDISADGVLMVGRQDFPTYESVVYDLGTRTPHFLSGVVDGIVSRDYDAFYRFSQDGRFLAMSHRNGGGDVRLTLLNAVTGAVVHSVAASFVSPIEFDVSGDNLYSESTRMDTATGALSGWTVPMPSGSPFAPIVFVQGQDLAVVATAFNSAFSPNTSAYIASTQVQSNPAWYSLPTQPKWVATNWGVAPVIPPFWTQRVNAYETVS